MKFIFEILEIKSVASVFPETFSHNMQIFINPILNEDGVEEWAIVELQGDLGSKEEATLDAQFVGDLYYNRDGLPIFIIGHHILFGTFQKLEKPFAVLKKVRHTDDKPSTEYGVEALVKRKLSFRERPKPIVGVGLSELPRENCESVD